MFIVNADDFGRTGDVSRAILASFKAGIVSSTTIQSNMPGFDEACEIAHADHLLDFIGVHFTLTEGSPLTERIKRQPRLCDTEGRFRSSKSRPVWLSGEERAAIFEELTAQVVRCREKGLLLTHADSHHHSHTWPQVNPIVRRICRQHNIPFIRLTRNIGPVPLIKQAYKKYLNFRLRWCGLAGVSYFGSLSDLAYEFKRGNMDRIVQSAEVSAHPLWGPNGTIVDGKDSEDLARLVRTLLIGVPLVSYRGKTFS